MGGSRHRLQDEIDEYVFLCGHYKEEVQTTEVRGVMLPNADSDHMRQLWERYQEEVTASVPAEQTA